MGTIEVLTEDDITKVFSIATKRLWNIGEKKHQKNKRDCYVHYYVTQILFMESEIVWESEIYEYHSVCGPFDSIVTRNETAAYEHMIQSLKTVFGYVEKADK